MVRTTERGGGGGGNDDGARKPHGRKHPQRHGSRRRKSGGGARHHARHAPPPGRWHEAPGAATAAGHTPSRAEASAHVIHPAGRGLAPLDLEAGRTGYPSLGGLGGPILELVGARAASPGDLTLALAAWQRESERVTNRAWRRPGGLVKLGGL